MGLSAASISIIALIISGLALLISYLSFKIAKKTSERDQTRFEIETKKVLKIGFEFASGSFVLVGGKMNAGPKQIKIRIINTGNSRVTLNEVVVLGKNEIQIEKLDISKNANIVIAPSGTEIYTFPISRQTEENIELIRIKDSDSNYYISQKKS